jgi:hypothetical protein
MKFKLIAAILAVSTFSASVADARPIKRGRTGGLICGLTQRIYFHIQDTKYNLARAWAVGFPHTSVPAPGVVVVQSRKGRDSAGNRGGHVSRIVSLTGNNCEAIVADEKGQYKRNICRAKIAWVIPSSS